MFGDWMWVNSEVKNRQIASISGCKIPICPDVIIESELEQRFHRADFSNRLSNVGGTLIRSIPGDQWGDILLVVPPKH